MSKNWVEFYNEETNNLFTTELFPHMINMLSTCGQSMFDNNEELIGIPKD